MKALSLLKAYLRKRAVYRRRKKAKALPILKINKRMLAECRQKYTDRIDAIAEKAKALAPRETKDTPKKPFTGYRILSYNGDMMGKVLKKDGKIYRGVYAASAEWFEKLWCSGLIQALAEARLVPGTYMTDYGDEEFPIVLEHERVEISTVKMWNTDMVRDACITVAIVNEVCKRFGYKLIDGHLNNITFVSGKPMFIDIGSIVEDRGQYTVYESSLVFAGGYKLIAAALGNSIIDRLQFFDEDNNAPWIYPFNYDESTIECRGLLKEFRRRYRWRSSFLAKKLIVKLFELGQVSPEYFELIFPKASAATFDTANSNPITELISKTNVESVTVIGGATGVAQHIHDRFGCKTVVLDRDAEASRTSYRSYKGISCYSYNYLYGGDAASLNCIRSQLVVAENVTENLVSYQNWKLDSVFNGLSKLTSRYVAVSFCRGRKADRCTDVAVDSYEAFERKFAEFFKLLSVTEADGCRVYLGSLAEGDLC